MKKNRVLNFTYHISLAQLKDIMTKIYILLTPDNEHDKVLRDVPMMKVGVALVKSLDVKFTNILYLLDILHHLVQNAHMRLDWKI